MGKTMANREVADIILYDYATGKPFLNIDYANMTTNEHTATSVYAKGGKGAPNRIRFDGERTSTLKLTTQVIDFDLMAVLAGAEVNEGVNVFKREVLTAQEGGVVNLSQTPVESSITVFESNDDCGTALETSVSQKAVTITEGNAGGEYIVYYQASGITGAKEIQFRSDSFPKAYKLVGETLFKDEASEELLPFQIIAHKAQPQSAFSMRCV